MPGKSLCAVLTIAVLVSCSAPHPVTSLPPDPDDPPPDPVVDSLDSGASRLLVVTMSGGGKRASAFSQGALNALSATALTNGRSILDEVDIVSSTSGGSVTAANFAYRGEESFAAYREKFLKKNFMPRLYWRTLNPPAFFSKVLIHNSRIEPLVDIFEETVFGSATLGDVQSRSRAPYLILNATDISSGLTFAMTQFYFDLICADSRPYPLARAVAASAAFPVALSPITLKNQCLGLPPEDSRLESRTRILKRRLQVDPEDPDPSAAPDDPAGRTWALRYSRFLSGEVGYVHLFDGGISDNLGLSEPLRLLSSSFKGNPYHRAMRNGVIDDVLLISVDSRSSSEPDFEQSAEPPNMIETLLSVIGGTIDSRTSGLTVQASFLNLVFEKIEPFRCRSAGFDPDTSACRRAADAGRYRPLEGAAMVAAFDNIRDKTCRRGFAELPTDWGLTALQVDALMDLGEGLVLSDRRFQRFAEKTRVRLTKQQLEDLGNAKIEQACDCFRGTDAPCLVTG